MKYLLKLLFILCISIFSLTVYADQNQAMTPEQSTLWIQQALHYGFAMDTTDYSKYISKDYIEHIDGQTFNYQQWLHHMLSIKNMMKAYNLSFDEIVVEGDQIATSYVVHATKKDGSKLDIRIIAIFKIKNGKMVYCDELTHLLNGPASEKNLSDKQ
jgi:hypothetical protein